MMKLWQVNSESVPFFIRGGKLKMEVTGVKWDHIFTTVDTEYGKLWVVSEQNQPGIFKIKIKLLIFMQVLGFNFWIVQCVVLVVNEK